MKKILVVEDVYENFFLINEILEDYETNILHAKNGKEFYSIINTEHNIDMILMDISLPDVSGIDLCHYIINENKRIPIIVISAYERNCELIFDMGISYFIRKPVMPELLISYISKYISLTSKVLI